MKLKINKNTTNAYTYHEKYNEQYYIYCKWTTYFFHNHLELNYKSFIRCNNFSSMFSLHSSTIYQLTFFYTYKFYSLNILQRHIIYSIYIHIWFQLNPLLLISLSIYYLHSHLHLSSFDLCLLLQTLASSLHLHYKFFVILCILFH